MSSKRFKLVVGLVPVLAVVAGVQSLYAVPKHNDFVRCPTPACTATCDPSEPALGTCRDGQQGTPFASTYACCCCNAEAKHRYFLGPK